MKKEKKTEKKPEKQPLCGDYNSSIVTDPFGSYTGTPENPYERPVQDADDL